MYKLISITDKNDKPSNLKIHMKYLGGIVDSITPLKDGNLVIKFQPKDNVLNNGLITSPMVDVYEIPDEEENVVIIETQNSKYYFVAT